MSDKNQGNENKRNRNLIIVGWIFFIGFLLDEW